MGTSEETKMSRSYLITLRCVNESTPFLNRRIITLHPGETMVLGRVSKNQKTEYSAKASNGYFDNPIVSRFHALLENRSPGIYVVDQQSTHGTYISGQKLTPLVPKQVYTGDCISLGSAIDSPDAANHLPTDLEVSIVPMNKENTRDMESARQVELPPFASNSFHAPDSDSEDEGNQPSLPTTWKPFAKTGSHGPRTTFSKSSTVGEDENKTEMDIPEENPWMIPDPVPVDNGNLTYQEIPNRQYLERAAHWKDPLINLASKSYESVEHGSDEDDKLAALIRNTAGRVSAQGDMEGTFNFNDTKLYPVAKTDKDRETDSWNILDNYLREEGICGLTDDDDDSEYDEDEPFEEYVSNSDLSDSEIISSDEDEEFHDESENNENKYDRESEEQEEQESEEEDSESVIYPVYDYPVSFTTITIPPPQDPVPQSPLPFIPASPTFTPLSPPFETPASQTNAQQTQSPPITPESNRKRSFQKIDETQWQEEAPLANKSAPLRLSTPPPFYSMGPMPAAEEFEIFKKELEANCTSERASKRQRVENGGWVGTVKTLGKYTLAGMIGGIATIAGLAWNASK